LMSYHLFKRRISQLAGDNMEITYKKTKEGYNISIKDEISNLGIDFSVSDNNFDLQKVFDFISDFVNQNYISQHEKRINGVIFANAKNG